MVRDFLDTSVLVAAFFVRASKSATACCAHSVAEVYSVMTSLPVRPAVSPDHALLFLEQLRERVAIVPLSEEDYFKTVRIAAEVGLTGGRIYDALLLAAAHEVEAKHVYTWNIRHFQQTAPDLERRLRTPE